MEGYPVWRGFSIAPFGFSGLHHTNLMGTCRKSSGNHIFCYCLVCNVFQFESAVFAIASSDGCEQWLTIDIDEEVLPLGAHSIPPFRDITACEPLRELQHHL